MRYRIRPWILYYCLGLGYVLGGGVGEVRAESRGGPDKQPRVEKQKVKPTHRRVSRSVPQKVKREEGLWQTVREFWGPKLKFVWEANREFWGPRIQRQVQESREFWGPRLKAREQEMREFWGPKFKFVWEANREYWGPTWEFVWEANREYWGDKLEKEYFPYIHNQYRFLKFHYGTRISRVYERSMEWLRPVLQEFPLVLFRESYDKLPSGWQFALENVPASVKKGFDRYFTWSLQHLPKSSGIRKQLPKPLQDTLEQLSQAMVLSRDVHLNTRVQRVFVRVRRFAKDQGMLDCYRAIALQSEVINAFNTGCSTYVTSGLAEMLSDQELAAVLAHELSHGDQGHAVKNLWLVSKSVGEHLYQLMSEEVIWYLTGRTGKVLRKVVENGNLIPILQVFGEKAPAVEIAADQGATEILLRAGLSPQFLITALIKLHGKNPKDVIAKDMRDIRALRNYPSLYRRIQAVQKVWRVWQQQQKKKP